MIKADIEISESILRKVNQNIYYLLEFFIDLGKDVDYEDILEMIFPVHYVRKNKERCIEILDELKEYTTDTYLHSLNPVQEYALFHLIEWWLAVTEVELEQIVDDKEIKTEDERYIVQNINNIDYYKSFLFYDWDFLEENLSTHLEFYKIYGPGYEDFRGIILEDYIELMPDDKKEEYYKIKTKFKTNNQIANKRVSSEQLIVKQIYNAIKLRENDPRRLYSTSEAELSNDIRDIVREKLQDSNIIFEREMPTGYAKVGIGESDFYIYTYEQGIYKTLAIGENKEWGKFESQLKQLIGYMTKDVQFGFTIIFNKSVQANTVLSKRIEILKNFYVEKDGEKYFQLVDGIFEHKKMNDVLLTRHENPDKKGTYFNIYHFIINANSIEREASALQARK